MQNLDEPCRRLVASGMLPGRAGQPTQILVHMSLSQLRDLPGASAAEAAWAAARAGQTGWVTGPEADAAACDASVVPIVTGHLDPAALDHLTQVYLATRRHGPAGPGPTSGTAEPGGAAGPEAQPGPVTGPDGPDPAGCLDGASSGSGPDGASSGGGAGHAGGPNPAGGPDGASSADGAGLAGGPDGMMGQAAQGSGRASGGVAPGVPQEPGATPPSPGQPPAPAPTCPSGCRSGGCQSPPGPVPPPLSPHTQDRLRRALLGLATDALSGPGGLAAQLRAGLDGPLATVSLPLDTGPATETIPAHLRRAVTTRHPHCAFPGCAQPASACEIHHIIPRSRGGPTTLANLLTLCTFHHKIVIHRWGWTIRLNSDGTTTATSPYGHTLHSHSPPSQAA
jgi:hypothetical protein